MGLKRILRRPWKRRGERAPDNGHASSTIALPPVSEPQQGSGSAEQPRRKAPRDIREWIEFRERTNGTAGGFDEPPPSHPDSEPNGRFRGRLVDGLESYLAKSAADLDERGEALLERERQLATAEQRIRTEEDELVERHERIATELADIETVGAQVDQLLNERADRSRRVAALEEKLGDREAELRIAEAKVAEAGVVLADRETQVRSQAAELKKQGAELDDLRTRLERGAAALEAAEERVAELEQRMSERATPQRRDGPDAESHLLFVPGTTRYSMIERAGDPPPLGSEVAVFLGDGERRFLVSKLAGSPLPLDGRPCAYLQATF